MTHEMCRHYTVDGSAYCDRCRDEWYIDSVFEMNGHDYQVWAYYGTNDVTGEVIYSCRLKSGMGGIYLGTGDIDNATSEVPYWAPQPQWHDEY